MSVTVAPVETTRVARTLNTTGTVAARDLIAVLPQTTGFANPRGSRRCCQNRTGDGSSGQFGLQRNLTRPWR